jgi:peptidoglycan/LPS O-acetylase OafA/YrhL
VVVNSRRNTPERKARYLVLPSLLIAAAAVVILPWLIKTKRMLQNEYWEGQLLFAIIALSVTACGVPLMGLRLFRRVPVVAPLGWGLTAFGYLMMLLYMVQSHLPPGPKIVFLAAGALCLRWAILGFALDRERRTARTPPGRILP